MIFSPPFPLLPPIVPMGGEDKLISVQYCVLTEISAEGRGRRWKKRGMALREKGETAFARVLLICEQTRKRKANYAVTRPEETQNKGSLNKKCSVYLVT